MNRKDRKHAGRYTPLVVGRGKRKELFEQGIEPREEFDAWKTPKDGMRFNNDRTMLRNSRHLMGDSDEIKKYNHKIRIKERIRKARKKSKATKHAGICK